MQIPVFKNGCDWLTEGTPLCVMPSIRKDMPLSDGTPRVERGYRSIALIYSLRAGRVVRAYAWSPLFKTQAEAMAHTFCHER